MALGRPPFETDPLVIMRDRLGRAVRQTFGKTWRKELQSLWDTVGALNVMQQKSLIYSFDEMPQGGVAAAVAWPASNMAFYVPFTVYGDITIKRILVPVIVASGNIDVAIYNSLKVRVANAGSVPAMAASTAQALSIANVTLQPGRYYMALAADNAVFQGIRYADAGLYNRQVGVHENAAAFPLPATATFREHLSRALIPSIALDSIGGQISIVYVGASANVGAASGDLVVTPPTTQTNDIMLCAVTAREDNVALSFPAGWTIYREGNNTNGGTDMRSTLAWKRATGAEVAFTVTHPAGGRIAGSVMVYRSCVATGSPINASSLRHNASSVNVVADAVTPNVPNCLIVMTGHTDGTSGIASWACTDPATLTQRVNNTSNVTRVAGADGYNIAGGSTGNATLTVNVAEKNTGGLTALTPMEK